MKQKFKKAAVSKTISIEIPEKWETENDGKFRASAEDYSICLSLALFKSNNKIDNLQNEIKEIGMDHLSTFSDDTGTDKISGPEITGNNVIAIFDDLIGNTQYVIYGGIICDEESYMSVLTITANGDVTEETKELALYIAKSIYGNKPVE
ncbi:MAG: hypothetical protein MJB14_12175 [Spirochaetes bacterium]|nr:hypothetical protein [Spirochaetota bacterium]